MMGVSSRSSFDGLFRFLLVTLLAFVLLTASTLAIAAGLAYLRGGDWNHIGNLVVGLCCGLIAWLFVAIFHLRHETQELGYSQPDVFLAKAKSILQEMGYVLVGQNESRLTFHPNFHAYLFGGAIQVSLEGHLAKVTGPKLSIETFRRQYRLQHHVDRVQQVLRDQRKVTDTRLKRVELRLRLQPERFQAVRDNVISLLEENGEVVCELNLLVHSEQGIREETLEFQVREWLMQEGISFDIHKDLAQFVEVSHDEREPVAV